MRLRPRLLVTRAEPEAHETAVLVARYGGESIVAPLRFEDAMSEPPPPGQPDRLVATSARALRLGVGIPPAWLTLPITVVGRATAKAAHLAGFHEIEIAEGDVESLIAQLEGRAERLLYLAGEPRRPELENWALRANRRLDLWLRYQMRDCDALPDAVSMALARAQCDLVLHFSRESATILDRLARKAGQAAALYQTRHACLSRAIAKTVMALAAAQGRAVDPIVATEREAEILVREALSTIVGSERSANTLTPRADFGS